MESFDQRKAQRVWDRVNGGRDQEPDTAALTALMNQELTDAAACLRLSKRLGGRGGDLLKLAQGYRQHAGYLRGICSILGNRPGLPTVPVPREEPPHITLRKCYVNSLHRMREYETRSQDPDYGPAFRKMAAATQDHCATLLSLIGKLAT